MLHRAPQVRSFRHAIHEYLGHLGAATPALPWHRGPSHVEDNPSWFVQSAPALESLEFHPAIKGDHAPPPTTAIVAGTATIERVATATT